jgi:chromosomal replication initiator protein
VKLVAYSSVTGSPITLAMAQQIAEASDPQAGARITMDSVLRAVAEKFQLQPSQLKQKTNARQKSPTPGRSRCTCQGADAVLATRDRTRMFGGKHHTTVLHSVQKIDKLRQKDADLNRLIHSVIDSIH